MSKGRAQIIGWEYSLTMDMVFCHGPVDEVQAISFGDREAWAGTRVGSGDIFVNARELFGGKQREGGVWGTVHAAMGEATQGQNPHLVSLLGSDIPAYRGVFRLIFNSFTIGSNNPYLKKLAVRFKRIKSGWSIGACWYETKADIAGAMNPAHIVYQCLTDTEWGMGYPTSSIDDTQFRQAADALFSEGFGLCLMWNRQAKIEDFLGDVCDHIGALVRADPVTGRFQLKLIRDDYSVGALTTLDENNSTRTDFKRPNWGETTNEIVLNYTQMNSGLTQTVAVQDLANIAIQNSTVSASRDYPGIVSTNIAGRIAMRDLRTVSTPLAKVQLVTNRKGLNINIGDVVKWNDEDLGIVGMPIRILNISYGTLVDGSIKIDAVEDIYGMPTTTYVAPQGVEWTDPATPPIPTTLSRLEEAPYWEVQRSSSAGDFAALTDTSALLTGFAGRPGVGMFSFNLGIYDSVLNSYPADESAEFAPHCLTTTTLNYTQTTVGYASDVNISAVELGSYGYIDNECIVITAINSITHQLTIKRGMMDTVPAKHALGVRIWFSEDYTAASTVERVQGEYINAKFLTVSAMGVLPEGSAPTVGKSMVGRFGRPYAPARVRIAGEDYPVSIISAGALTVTWNHRDRTQQTGEILVDQFAGNIGPEVGVTYSIIIYNSTTFALIASGSGITGNSFTTPSPLPLANFNITIELYAVRASIQSYQRHVIDVQVINPVDYRITEVGDSRVLENGTDDRITD